jgi:hypothetical protein
MSWIANLNQARADAVQHREHVPWLAAVRRALPPNIDTISTRSVLDLIDMPATTGNSRKIAAVMRILGYVPIKSRRLAPGGFRDTTTRGWTKPVLEKKSVTCTLTPTGAVGADDAAALGMPPFAARG